MPFQKMCFQVLCSVVLFFFSIGCMAKTLNDAKSDSKVMPWMNQGLAADERAGLVLKEMTQEEKLSLVFGYFATDMAAKNWKRPAESLAYSAGFIPGIARLGIPAQFQTDAGVGVATQGGWATPRERTALPAGLSTAATWNLDLAYAGGAMIGAEARLSGFNVMLAGGVNLQREPRNGRNFEYAGEDPLLAGHIVGQQIKGIQSNKIVSTLKHFAMNNQEQGRFTLSANIDDAAARMSDLLAFQIANEVGEPGSVMCAYNRVNSFYSCESDYLLNQVLKKDWGFKGYVMSDWGGTHSTTQAANNGLDQQSGYPFDESAYFAGALKEAVAQNWVTQTRLNDMVHRILRSLFAQGVIDNPVAEGGVIDFAAHAKVTQRGAEEGMVLLKNSNKILPLNKTIKKIVVIGGHADVGVLAGGGSSTVYPVGGLAVKGLEPKVWPGPIVYFPSSPLKAIQSRMSDTQFVFDQGDDVQAVAKLAATADAVIVFADQWVGESFDMQTLALPKNQDALITAVAKANAKTIVVLETGTPVLMPWLNKVGAVLQAWYPGTRGGEAIAAILTGEVNPSGHLPATFPMSLSQLPRPVLDGDPKNDKLRFDVNYHEGAAVGYKWFDLNNIKPLFPFGYGLSYTQFSYSNLASSIVEGNLKVQFAITNKGALKGKDVAQVYVSPAKGGWEAPKRLVGWAKVDLAVGETKNASVTVDPRLLAIYDSASKTWRITEGDYTIILAEHAGDEKAQKTVVHLPSSTLDVKGKVIK